MRIVAATPAHRDALVALERACFPPPARPWGRQQLAAQLEDPLGLGWLAQGDEDRLLGYATFRRVLDEAELLRIATDPAARRQGVARALLETAFPKLDATGVERYFLEVRQDNRAARALYQRFDFQETGLRRGYFADGCDAVLMARSTIQEHDPKS